MSRYGSISFTVSTACTIHGFAGSFESVLYKVQMSKNNLGRQLLQNCIIICYKPWLTAMFEFSELAQDVMISIAPQSHSPGMFSWFPLFIPLATPLRVNVGDNVVINIWRWELLMRSSLHYTTSSHQTLDSKLLFICNLCEFPISSR